MEHKTLTAAVEAERLKREEHDANLRKYAGVVKMLDFLTETGLPKPDSISLWSEPVSGSCPKYGYEFQGPYQPDEPDDARIARGLAASREWIANIARVATRLGKAVKQYDNDRFRVIIRTGDFELTYSVAREAVCRRVVTGVKHIEASEELVKTEAHDEEIVEWICDEPLLK